MDPLSPTPADQPNLERTRPLGPAFAAFIDSPVPRAVPAGYAAVARSQSGGWIGIIIGVVFLGVGLGILVMRFPLKAVISDYRFGPGVRLDAPGEITVARRSRNKSGSVTSSHYTFRYQNGDGWVYGDCYRNGGDWAVGRKGPVEALPSDPSVVRLVGSRLTPGEPGDIFIALIFAGFGGWSLWNVLRLQKLYLRMLAEGDVVEIAIVRVWQPMLRSRGVIGKMEYIVDADPITTSISSRKLYDRAFATGGGGALAFALRDASGRGKVFFAEFLLDDGT